MFMKLEKTEPTAAASSDVEAAQKFYCEALGGRQIRATAGAEGAGELWFLVDGVLVKTGRDVCKSSAHVALRVDDAEETAVRCWDAGFTIRVHPGPLGSVRLTVIDPFDLEIALVARRNAA